METHITVTFTKEQAKALEWIADYGIGEHDYALHHEHPYAYNKGEIRHQEKILRYAQAARIALNSAI